MVEIDTIEDIELTSDVEVVELEFPSNGDMYDFNAMFHQQMNRQMGFGLGKVFGVDEEEPPRDGWDSWCSRVSKKGKIARILRTISKNVMSFELEGGEDLVRSEVNNLIEDIDLRAKLMFAYRDWMIYGRCFIELVWNYNSHTDKLAISKMKILNPNTITVYRDSIEDIEKLQKEMKYATDHYDYINSIPIGMGDEIVAFIQKPPQSYMGRMPAQFFKPDDLIFLPRYPDHDLLDGVSLLRENYDTIMNKLGYEKSQSIMVRRHIDPKLIFTLPEPWWNNKHQRTELLQQLKYGIRAGMDLFIPVGVTINTLQASGGGGGVSEAIKHTEDEFNASLGWADSFSQSDSSNRAVSQTQMEFYERDISTERALFVRVIIDKIIKPFCAKNFGYEYAAPKLVWKSIAPDDKQLRLSSIMPYVDYLPYSQLLKLMEDIGYSIPLDELDEFFEIVKKIRGEGQDMMGGMPGMEGNAEGGAPGMGFSKDNKNIDLELPIKDPVLMVESVLRKRK